MLKTVNGRTIFTVLLVTIYPKVQDYWSQANLNSQWDQLLECHYLMELPSELLRITIRKPVKEKEVGDHINDTNDD